MTVDLKQKSNMKKHNTALLVIDMQNSVVASAYLRDEVIANINKLVQKARSKKNPVIWIQHSSNQLKINSDGWKYVPELQRQNDETLVHKVYGDSFEATNLTIELDKLNVRRVIIVGAQTDACIRATLHGAFVRGYDTVLVSDAHTTEDLTSYGLPSPEKIIAFTNMYWTWQEGPGREACVVKTADVEF